MSTKPNNPAQTKSTQASLLISEVKDGIVVLRDGSLRAVVLASAINFDLMSTQEQDSVEYSFQGFLNALHFPIQIVIKSQKIDLDAYVEKLSKLRGEQDNPLLANLMEDYIANIQALVEEVNIMDKQFYVVIPYFPPMTVTKTGLVENLKNVLKAPEVITVDSALFEQYKTELSQRVQLVAGGLTQLGVRAISLNSQELIELYYNSYNPDVAANQKLIDATQFQSAAVTRGGGALRRTEEGGPKPDNRLPEDRSPIAATANPQASVPGPQSSAQPTSPPIPQASAVSPQSPVPPNPGDPK